jgi:hypothetical protein
VGVKESGECFGMYTIYERTDSARDAVNYLIAFSGMVTGIRSRISLVVGNAIRLLSGSDSH